MKTWESRCYVDGIPDEVPNGLYKAMRAPSYKAIAMAILRNDHNLHSIGFSERKSETVNMLLQMDRKQKDKNYDLFR